MNTQRVRTVVAPAALGLLAPMLWTSALGWWANFGPEALFRWLWVRFQIKGDVAFFMSAALEVAVFACVFGLALRVAGGANWRTPSLLFSGGFLLALYGSAVFVESSGLEFSFATLPFVAALLGATSLVHWAASRGTSSHDA